MQLLLLSAVARNHFCCDSLLVKENVQRDSRLYAFILSFMVLLCFALLFACFWLVSLWTVLQLRAQKVSLNHTSVIDPLERACCIPWRFVC